MTPANPYTARKAITKPEAFFGRKQVSATVYGFLDTRAARQMQNCSIVGPRRIGKSSLLHHLVSTYSEVLPDPESYVVSYMDMTDLDDKSQDDFFRKVAQRLASENKSRYQFDAARYGDAEHFCDLLRDTGEAKLKLVLCCDEFESLTQNPNFGDKFFIQFRSYCQNYNLALVTASRVGLWELCHRGNLLSSKFWNIFPQEPLGLMTPKEARELVCIPFSHAGVNLDEKEIEFVLNLAGRHPFFIQMACHRLFDSKVGNDAPDYLEVGSQFMEDAYPHLKATWDLLHNNEKSALAALAHADPKPLDNSLFENLKKQALVVGNAGSPSLVSLGLRQFIERRHASQEAGPPSHVLRDLAFVSYAHEDKKFVDEFETVFTPFKEGLNGELWVDNRIKEGEFDIKIPEALKRTKVGVLFVSPDYLNSKFISEVELKELFAAYDQDEAKLLWVLIRTSGVNKTRIGNLKCFHRTENAVQSMNPEKRALLWTELSQRIVELMQ